MGGIGKILIFLGLTLVLVGVVLSLAPKIPWLGQLPGDIYVKRDNFTFYFPLTTCILISLILSLVLYLFRR
ncbi:MAG TPA: DUF2905 domain-containing protein [Candidatus Acidoferrales bacterium]|nr:DUF2905 domain-containing protein [Candidatus Acidoferrales bacterium]